MIKEFGVGMPGSPRMYFIDSNVLLAMCPFYYKGKCNTEGIIEELKEFILRARMYGVQNQFAITEICYDYNGNSLNCEQMQKVMIAFDNLLMNMSEGEIRNHKGTTYLEAKRNEKRSVKYKSIFDCKLPDFFFEDTSDIKNLFYEIYLYLLKIYSLYNEHTIEPMDKIRKLFEFMTGEIDLFLGYEFYMGVMLFIGVNNEKDIAKGIFKPRQCPELHHILNSTIDIFQYRMICFISDFFASIGNPQNVYFVTLDECLQEYIEHNVTYNTVISSNMITPINEFMVRIDGKYEAEWREFYNAVYEPRLYERYIQSHMMELDDAQRDEIHERIINNIIELEKIVLTI